MKWFAFVCFALLFLPACDKSCREKANDGSICTAIYDPVCGCNNKTYSSACVAASYGIHEFTPGECP